MKFDYAIGNPPYNLESTGANESDTPLYHYFYDAAFMIAKKVELITPARFLFNAGYTPKNWNEQMLSDCHLKCFIMNLKVIKYLLIQILKVAWQLHIEIPKKTLAR